MPKNEKISVQGTEIAVMSEKSGDYISLTDMLKAKDGEFFISDWLRNRNTLEFLGIWESVYNLNFNYGEFAAIKSQAGLNSFKISGKAMAGAKSRLKRKYARLRNLRAVGCFVEYGKHKCLAYSTGTYAVATAYSVECHGDYSNEIVSK